MRAHGWIAPLIVCIWGTVVAVSCVSVPTASLSLTAVTTAGIIEAVGSTDLPEGAIVSVRAVPTQGDLRVTQTAAMVTDGRYEAELDVSDFPSGEVTVVAQFRVGADQPASVIDRFGMDGERLSGPQVRVDSDDDGGSEGVRILETSARVTLP